MAEAVLYGVAVEIIKKLGSGELQEIGLLWGVKDEFDKLKATVSTIKAVLLDAEKQYGVNNQVRDWLSKLKDVLYDADDLLDDFSTEALRRQVMSGSAFTKEVRLFFSCSNRFIYGVKMGHKIKGIRERLDTISKDRRDFHLVESLSERTRSRRRGRAPSDSFVNEETVIGRDHDKEIIVRRLLLQSINVAKNVAIIPIVGIGGLGKTTLAQLVYNCPQVKNHFEVEMWVCVSDLFDVKEILEKAIISATGRNLEVMVEFKRQFLQVVDGKRYLLVLDDVWNDKDYLVWDELKEILNCGVEGSRIIVTTRSEMVAKMSSTLEPHTLRGLDFDEAWTLFMRFQRRQLSSKAIKIGQGVVEKCKGVPLAIKTIASLLCSKAPETQWSSFMEEEFSKVTQDESGSILPTLKLSYDHLPSHLKQCFAYCRLFPKDHILDVEKLIHLWISQGFVVSTSHSSGYLEDVGRECFMNLFWRSFFQEVTYDEWGDAKWCKMHDLMHDLAISVAGRESSIINISKTNMENKNNNITIAQKNICHLSFYFERPAPLALRFPTLLMDSKERLRSILLLGNVNPLPNYLHIEALYGKEVGHLRVRT